MYKTFFKGRDFKSRVVLFICVTLLCGYTVGCCLIRTVPFDGQWAVAYIEDAGLILSAVEATAVAVLVYLSGFSVIGAFFDCAIIYLRMVVMGYFMAGYYSLYGISGIWRVLIFGLPCGAVMIAVLLLLASESVCTSLSILDEDVCMPVKLRRIKAYSGSGAFLVLCTLIFVTWRGLIAPFLAGLIF